MPSNFCFAGFGVDPDASMFELAGEFPAFGSGSFVGAFWWAEGFAERRVIDERASGEFPAPAIHEVGVGLGSDEVAGVGELELFLGESGHVWLHVTTPSALNPEAEDGNFPSFGILQHVGPL